MSMTSRFPAASTAAWTDEKQPPVPPGFTYSVAAAAWVASNENVAAAIQRSIGGPPVRRWTVRAMKQRSCAMPPIRCWRQQAPALSSDTSQMDQAHPGLEACYSARAARFEALLRPRERRGIRGPAVSQHARPTELTPHGTLWNGVHTEQGATLRDSDGGTTHDAGAAHDRPPRAYQRVRPPRRALSRRPARPS